MSFRMNVTTNFKFKPFKKGIVYDDDSVPAEVLDRWLNRKIAKKGPGRPKKDDNTIIQSNISSEEELPGNN